MLADNAAYDFEFNGENTGIKVSISQALLSDEWDFVTLQQVSSKAPFFESYVLYIEKLAEYVRLNSPKSKILLHQTWAYEKDSKCLNEELGFSTPQEMLDKIIDSYNKAADLISADGIIPCDEMMQKSG